MKCFIATSDWHLTTQRPSSRTDQFPKTPLRKARFVINQAQKHDGLLCLAGDLFDTPYISGTPFSLIEEVIGLLKPIAHRLCLAAGQHDMRYHQKSLQNTPFSVVVKACEINRQPKTIKVNGEEWFIQICDWGSEIPQPVSHPALLVVHETIIQPTMKFPGKNARDFLAKYGYDLVISGDNHLTFMEEYRGRVLVNTGSLVRLSIDQKDRQPVIAKITPENGKLEVEWIKIPIEPDVFEHRPDETDSTTIDIVNYVEKLRNCQIKSRDVLNIIKKAARAHNVDHILKIVLRRLEK